MASDPPAPPNPLFGVLTFGFLIFIIYSLIRLSNEGEARFKWCKRAILFEILGMAIVSLLETLLFWNWSLQTPSPDANLILVWGVTMMLGLFFKVLMINFVVKWYFLRR